jgi:hypothetical protein
LPGILVGALIVGLLAYLLFILASFIWTLQSWIVSAFLRFSGKAISPSQLRQVFNVIADEIQHVMDQWASRGGAAETVPANLGEPALIIPTRYSIDYTSKVLPLEREYTCTMAGAALKLVCCEACAVGYVYRMNRSVQQMETSSFFLNNAGAEAGAASKAEAQLRDELERSVDAVPCPACGWYQQNMLRKARTEHRQGMLYAGIYLTVGVIALALIGVVINTFAGLANNPLMSWRIFWGMFVAMTIPGLALIAARFALAARYDPNSEDVETRKQIGQDRAIPREEFESMISVQGNDKPETAQGA